jgi:protein AroM
MVRAIGLVTIGQSPRADLADEYERALPGVSIVQAGALDDLSEAQVAGLRPEAGDEVLVSRLRTGREVRLARRHVEPRLQACLDRVRPDVDLTVLLCTGEFPALRPRGLVLVPQQVLRHVVSAVVDGLRGSSDGAMRVGVMTPDPAQQGSAEARWGSLGQVVAVAASPYRGIEGLEGAAKILREARAGIVVMDCVGYTRAMRRIVAGITDAPTILANASVAMIAREVLGDA